MSRTHMLDRKWERTWTRVTELLPPWLGALLWLAASSMAAGVDIDFARDIQPIFQRHCVDCHGIDEQNGGLNLDQLTTLFAEAHSGQVPVVPGQPEESELIRRVLSRSEDERMPPDGERLTIRDVQLLRSWIKQGAAKPSAPGSESPQAESADGSKSFWSFQPVRDVEPPEVREEEWAGHAIDRFLQAKRESMGLRPVQEAEPLVLLRRVTYDLSGLPPTPEEAADFSDAVEQRGMEKAFAELIDELLNRPTYGQRWGRHWMDWVRYADTAGDNSDFPIPQAYLYRNYIIDAFNDDLPYDRFVVEQIAGDLLPAQTQELRNRQVIATGYLAMARRFGSLVERYPWHLTIEDTIDNIGRTMLGLTVSCARCHDHKFDPISMRDYYGLYGIFASTQYPFPGIELFQAQDDLVPLIPGDEAEALLKPYQEKTDQLRGELERLLEECEQRALENTARESQVSLAEQRRMQDELDAMLLKARKAGEALAKHLKEVPDIPAAYAVREGTPHNARIQIKGEPFRPGAEVPRRFPTVLGGHLLAPETAEESSGRLQLAQWITDPANPLTARVIVNRIWQRHFGTGLVPSTSDFGLRGESPTHPELLDWLASEFVRQGWSIKKLHRIILTSQAYHLASNDSADNLNRDPTNRYYWKFSRQRLDAESIRDTLLYISGQLDLAPQTEPYPIPPEKEWTYTQHHPFKDDYPSNKRSVYLMTKRLTAKPYFQTFDGPDPNVCTSNRGQSVTALQALYFVNDEFVHEQAQRFAEILLEKGLSDEDGIRYAFSTTLTRSPSSAEMQLLTEHLAAVRDQFADDVAQHGQATGGGVGGREWTSLVRSLFRVNEFLYLD
jgi:mono/diheme cytochrome c family protein